MFFDGDRVQIIIANSRKSPDIMISNNALLNSLCKRKTEGKLEGILNGMKMKAQYLNKNFGDAIKTVLGRIFLVLKTLVRNKKWSQIVASASVLKLKKKDKLKPIQVERRE